MTDNKTKEENGSDNAVQVTASAAVVSVARAASKEDDDANAARRLQSIEQLTQIFGFEHTTADNALRVLGPPYDVTQAYNYILDQGLGQDKGGPVSPILDCPHIKKRVKLSVEQLPTHPQSLVCTHFDDPETPKLKSESMENGNCPGEENWLCLECGVTRCSRYINAHGVAHWEDTKQQEETEKGGSSTEESMGHCVAVSLADLSVWCYCCRAYVRHHTLDPIVKRLEQLKFEDENENEDDDSRDRKRARSTEPEEEKDTNGESCSGQTTLSINFSHSTSSCAKESDGSEGEFILDIPEGADEETILDALRTQAAARGIPLEFFMSAANDDDDEPIQYPFDNPPTSLQDVADFIVSEKCEKIVILAGAGMSVASGIPDFRSADGLYATMDPDLLTCSETERLAIRLDPSVALEQTLFEQNPLPCLEINRDFILGTREQRWKATLAHRFVEQLQKHTGKLARLYTQNIDGLEDQCTDLPREKVIAVHGSMDRAECAHCKSEASMDWFAEKVRSQIKDLARRDSSAPNESTPIQCTVCGSTAMKPGIVLFRSSLPKAFFECLPKDVLDADLLIVIGTSLRVAPANSIVWRVPHKCMRVLVNREKVGAFLGLLDDDESERDFFAQGDCDEVLLDLMQILGWAEELEPLLQGDYLPNSSARLLSERIVTNTRVSEIKK